MQASNQRMSVVDPAGFGAVIDAKVTALSVGDLQDSLLDDDWMSERVSERGSELNELSG